MRTINKTISKKALFKKIISKYISGMILIIFCLLFTGLKIFANELSNMNLHVIPYPQQVQLGGEDFIFSNKLTIVLDKNHSKADLFAAEELILDLKNHWNIKATLSDKKSDKSIILSRKQVPILPKPQGYSLSVKKNEIKYIELLQRKLKEYDL